MNCNYDSAKMDVKHLLELIIILVRLYIHYITKKNNMLHMPSSNTSLETSMLSGKVGHPRELLQTI